MKKRERITAAALGLVMLAGAALAHSGVKNAEVKARMGLMGEIKEATAVLGEMAKGQRAFDAAQAAAAREVLIDRAGRIGAAFEAEETDPKSEARPEIWSDWPGFTAKADAMAAAADALQVGSLAEVRAGMSGLAESCGGCHKLYRIDK